tara:strand:- start:1586 stop:2038 length:453 start_codon:yes stop_codon:yes gene_type:complete
MKINITVDLDWLDEGGNIDEEIQGDIISGVKKAISKDCLKIVEVKTQQAIDDGMQAAVDLMQEKVSSFFEDWINNEAVITDKYGDKVDQGTLKDIIKKEFSNCINEKVDRDGRPSNYNGSYTRLEFVTGKKVKEIVDDYLANYNKDIERQ